MPVGSIGVGFSNAMTDYLMKERQRQRDAEDQATDSQMQLIHELANKPNANPALLGAAIHDLADMHNAKANKKLKPGMEGFMGRHELPMSQFLSGIQDAAQGMGSRALEGPTTEPDVEKPSNTNDQAFAAMPQNGPMDQQGPAPQTPQTAPGSAVGASVGNGPALPAPPVPIPPAGINKAATSDGMVSAARQVSGDAIMNPPPPPIPATLAAPQTRDLPANRQPYFKDTATMNAEARDAASAKAAGATQGVHGALVDAAQAASDATGVDAGRLLPNMNKGGFTRPINEAKSTAQNAIVNGKRVAVMVNPQDKTITDLSGNELTGDVVLDGNGKGTTAQAFSVSKVQRPDGGYTTVWTPKAPPAQGQSSGIVTADTGVKGKLPNPPAGQTTLLTPAAIDMEADKMAAGAPSDTFGMGGRADKAAIINRFAEKYQNLPLAQQQAAYKGLTASLTKMQVQSNNLNAFENTAQKNLVPFLTAARQIPDTGSPLFNKPLREVDRTLLGAPEMAAYDMASSSVLPEFQRIISNPNLTGALTDSARHELAKFDAATATYPMLVKAVNILLTDAKNRTGSIKDEIDLIKKAMVPPGASGALPSPPSQIPGAGGGNAQSTAKNTTRELVHKYATEHGIDDDAAEEIFLKAGYTIVRPANTPTKPK